MAKQDEQQESERDAGQNGHDDDVARYEQELADYLQERIKPGLNSGAIPLLARSIAKDIAHRDHPNGTHESAPAGGTSTGEDDGEQSGGSDFEADMHELQAELGEDWILRFSVQGDDGWLTADKSDGSQHVEAQTASVLADAVELLSKDGGRSA